MPRILPVPFALSLLAAGLSPAAAQSYTAVPLGTLAGYDYAAAAGVNVRGQVIGTVGQQGSAAVQAFLWQNGVMQGLSGYQSEALAINASGVVAGEAQGATSAEHAVIWQNGTLTDLGTLTGGLGGPGSSIATGINDAGQVVGYSTADSSNHLHAFVWDATHGMRDLGTLGGLNSSAAGINALGQIVGTADTGSGSHAFLWDAARGMQDLGLPSGTVSPSQATAINGFGVVAGYGDYIDQVAHSSGSLALTWDQVNGWRGIGGGLGSAPSAINDLGQIVGSFNPGTSTGSHAFLSAGGVLTDLNAVTALPAGALLAGASAISANGFIVANTPGTYFGTTGPTSQAYLLTPAPEPPQADALAVGLLGLAGLALKARRRTA